MSFEESRAQTTSEPSRLSAESRSENEEKDVLPPITPSKTVDGPQSNLSDADRRSRLDRVLQSDIGVTTLLDRLKQSISSTRDFASFLKKRSTLEDEHAQGVKRLSRGHNETIWRPENRQGSFAQNYEELTRIHDKMSDHGIQFAMALQQMSDELNELASNVERGRKHWKHEGINATKKVQDSETALEKAKIKYDSLADQYDRARTGDRTSGRFGLKGPKSAAQQEEDLSRRVQAADADYLSKVQAAQSSRQEMTTTHRPQASKALQELIKECDSGLSLQMQKFASLNEKLLLGNGLCISPLGGQTNGAGTGPRSLREVAGQINNEKDLEDYILGFSNKAGSPPPEIKYEKHPALTSPKQSQPSQFPPQQSFNASQPQFGQTPGTSAPPAVRSDQGQRPNPSGQISGVTSYQNQARDGPPMQSQQGQYGPGPQGPYSQQGNNIPQIPPIVMSGGLNSNANPRSGVSPTGTSNEYRTVTSPLNQNATQPSTFRPGDVHSPVSVGSPTNYQSFTQPQIPSGNLRSGPPAMNPNSNSGFNGPPIAQQNTFKPTNNGAPYQPPSSGPPYPPSSSGPPFPQAKNGPPFTQANNGPPFPQANNGPPYGPSGGFRPQGPSNAAVDSRGPPTGPNGPNDNYRAAGSLRSNQAAAPVVAPAAPATQGPRSDMRRPNLPPLNPVFGVSLDELFRRDNSAVPMIVYQCVQAVDLFGLDVEGIYRTSGSVPHIMEMKAKFDNDSSQVDFRNPASFHHDIASVTTLLKHFLRDLPDPLLTGAQYNSFIQAAKIDDDVSRRDSLHAIINSLPDPNYATLRVLTLHLARVADHSGRNRMTPSNLAICFGPTLLGQGGTAGGGDIRDAEWQARVVVTILQNCFQIFDDDE